MLKGWLLSNTLNGICLTIATLFLLDKGPKILQNFASNSEYNDAKSTINKIIHSKVARTIKFTVFIFVPSNLYPRMVDYSDDLS